MMAALRTSVVVALFLLAAAGLPRSTVADEASPDATPSATAHAIDKARKQLGGPEHAKAVAAIRAAIVKLAKQVDDPAALVSMGRAHFYLEEDAKALAAFERASVLAPKDAAPVYWSGIVTQYSDTEQAEVLLRKATEMAPKKVLYLADLADLQRRAKKHEKAIVNFGRVLALDPDHAVAHLRLGNLLINAKQPAKAVEHLERSIALDGTRALARYNVAQVHYTAGRFEKALEHWQAGAKLAPDDFGMHKKAIQALYALGRHGEAEPHRMRVIELHKTQDPVPTSFCFDQFKAGDLHILAHERFDRTGDLVYHYTFKVYADDVWQRSINLESSAVLVELGQPYILGRTEKGGIHSTIGPTWTEMPPYPELKRLVIEVADGSAPGVSVTTKD